MANPKGNPQNLKPFKKGQSGNPLGPTPVLPELKELMTLVLTEIDSTDGKINAERIIRSLLKKATKGDVRACEVLLERGFGKTVQEIKKSGTTEIHVIRK